MVGTIGLLVIATMLGIVGDEEPNGQTLQRLYVRGEEPGGQHLLHVWAFTA